MFVLKQGLTFDRLLAIPNTFADSYFLNWTLESQIRTSSGKFIATLTATWATPATLTRFLRVYNNATDDWPVGIHEFDVKLTSPAGEKAGTDTQLVEINRIVTRPEPPP